MSPAIQAVLAWIAAHPLALCAGGAGIGGAAYCYSGNRTWGDAAIGALEGCEAGLSIYELADLLKGPQSRPNAGIAENPEIEGNNGKPGPVAALDTGQYKPLANRSVGDGMTPDHIPSHASRKMRLEAELGRPLTNQENRVLRDTGNCLVVKTCDHQQVSRTYGGRNNAGQIESDSLDPRSAAEADLAAWRDFFLSEGYSPDEIDRAFADLHALNQADGVYDD